MFIKRTRYALAILMIVLAGAFVIVTQTGLLTPLLQRQAADQLTRLIPPEYALSIGATRLSFDLPGAIGVSYRDISLTEKATGETIIDGSRLDIGLAAMSLLSDSARLSSVSLKGGVVDLPQRGGAFKLPAIAELDGLKQKILGNLATAYSALHGRSDNLVVKIDDLQVRYRAESGARSLRVARLEADTKAGLAINADLIAEGDGASEHAMQFTAKAGFRQRADGAGLRTSRLDLGVKQVPLPFGRILVLLSDVPGDNAPDQQHDPVPFDLTMSLARVGDGINAAATLDGGQLPFKLDEGDYLAVQTKLQLMHIGGDAALSVAPVPVSIGRSTMLVEGGIRDSLKSDDQPGNAYEFEIVLNDGRLSPRDSPERTLEFGGRAEGHMRVRERTIEFSRIDIRSAGGEARGEGILDFNAAAPVAVFSVTSDKMETSAVKQLWPAPVARGVRKWVLGNIAGGVVSNIRLEIAEPLRRRIEGSDTKLESASSVFMDIEGARFDIAGDIPPVRDANGRIEYDNRVAEITLQSGTVFMPGGRQAKASNGTLTIVRPPQSAGEDAAVPSHLEIDVAGSADAIGELISYRPIAAQRYRDYQPSDLLGQVKARVTMDFAINDVMRDGGPDWNVDLKLADTTIKTPVEGRKLTALNGDVSVSPDGARLDLAGKIDDLPAEIAMVIPFGQSPLKPSQNIVMTLGDKERARLAPGLDVMLTGKTPLAIDQSDGKTRISADLSNATLKLPWIGWAKGEGIAAKAGFILSENAGATRIEDFSISGKTFGATGTITADGKGLASAKLSDVKLNEGDNVAVDVSRQGAGYAIAVRGSQVDVRALLRQIRASMRETGSDDATPVTVDARVDRVTGFNGEQMRNVNVKLKTDKSGVTSLSVTATGKSGMPLSLAIEGQGRDRKIRLETLDAGEFLRFADIYAKVRGGVLETRLSGQGGGALSGTMKLSDFRVFNEKKLEAIVATRADNQRSLQDAIQKPINTQEVKFDLASADVRFGDGTLDIEQGIVRGPLVGLTGQGRVYDANNNMRLTGTFLPAYGLNSLFSDIPVLGAILGNGRDKALIGVTFLVQGSTDKPQVTVNPLSAVAPGIFRSIFEFR